MLQSLTGTPSALFSVPLTTSLPPPKLPSLSNPPSRHSKPATVTKSAPNSVPSAPPPPENDFEPEVSVEDGFEIEVRKAEKKKNRRVIRSRVRVDADLEIVWGVLTDYEGLGDFIPGLAVSQLIDKGEKFARLYQIDNSACKEGEFVMGQEFQTTHSYVVELEPKLWLPIRLLEGRLCKEVKNNLLCVREEAQ